MPLASAIARHAFALPYSLHASDCSESPATTRCTRWAVSAPDVGFWPCVGPGISTSDTWQVARMGTPEVPKRVYCASMDETYAVNRAVENEPHSKTTQGGDGCLAAMLLAVTSQHSSSDSTFFITVLPVGFIEESRKISRVISRGSAPMNSGFEPSRTAIVGVAFHWARWVRDSCAGLNSKLNLRISAPGLVVVPVGGSWIARLARTRLLPAPPLLPVAMVVPLCLPAPSVRESVVGDLQDLVGHGRAAGIEAGALPADGQYVDQPPPGDQRPV